MSAHQRKALEGRCCSHLNLPVQEQWSATAFAGGVYPQLFIMNLHKLRQSIRAQRRQLTPQTISAHARLMANRASREIRFLKAKRIAFYIGVNGEMDPAPLVDQAFAMGKQCYFPVLTHRPANRLVFSEFRHQSPQTINRFGIPEPAFPHRNSLSPWLLDLVFVPLVAFDLQGNRLGMGGGFYDRTFSFKTQRSHWRGPKLIGLAHEFQKSEQTLTANHWDIPLDAVITEKRVYRLPSV